MPAEVLDAHTGACPDCRRWAVRAEQLTRTLRTELATTPDLTLEVLSAVAADPRTARVDVAARSRRQILRVAVAVVAVAQLAVALPVLVAGVGLAEDPHTSRELASFDVAVAVGFALAAWRPERARAFVPVAFVLAVCLALTSTVDIANSTTALVHEVGHLASVVQAGLLWALNRADRGTKATAPPVLATGRG